MVEVLENCGKLFVKLVEYDVKYLSLMPRFELLEKFIILNIHSVEFPLLVIKVFHAKINRRDNHLIFQCFVQFH